MTASEPLLKAANIRKSYRLGSGFLRSGKGRLFAVDGVTIGFEKSKTTAVVGESGSGKSTLGDCILLLNRPDSGSVFYKGRDLTKLSEKELKAARTGMQIVFQDPASSLDPSSNVRAVLKEPILSRKLADAEIDRLIEDSLSVVGLRLDIIERHPPEFSTGQKQRIAIARALMSKPEFMVLDEPTSSLDVSTQLQILNLLRDLQVKYGMAYMFITHNLAVAKYSSHSVAVMFAGRIVEYGSARDVTLTPKHPYTAALLSSVPGVKKATKFVLREKGEEKSVASSGCRYQLRCPYATEKCLEEPSLSDSGNGHLVKCHYFADLNL